MQRYSKDQLLHSPFGLFTFLGCHHASFFDVKALSKHIDKAKVGIVDNFQGQEMPIVLISMVTLSPEDLARNIECIYSKNWLNVGILRIQFLAAMVAHSKLLEILYGTVKHMKLCQYILMAR